MFELLALTALIYLFLNRKKRTRKPRTLDAELKHLIQESNDATAIGSDIKRFLLDVLNDNSNDQEKFSDTRIADKEMLGRPGDGWRVSLTTLMNERHVVANRGGSSAVSAADRLFELAEVAQHQQRADHKFDGERRCGVHSMMSPRRRNLA